MSLTLYGLPNCDSCRKAQNWLKRIDQPFVFIDYRANPVAPEMLTGWAGQLGGFDALLNKASTTWRTLLPNKKSPGSTPEYLMLLKEYPALLKRPVLVFPDGRVVLGFKDALYKRLFSA
ncbi:MAG: Spx/MgsR family RNA polymerase-binding regulatory protein [Arenimonas sp.]